jgi:energy-coupling factor transporter ATP-binding protein EcfA2
MELVYLWVEEYKNIKEQGFNFSPRFECKFYDEYDTINGKKVLKDNCKLEINENKNYINIFPDNINITAIVGENGSGKSGMLKLLHKGLSIWNGKGFAIFANEKSEKFYLSEVENYPFLNKYKELYSDDITINFPFFEYSFTYDKDLDYTNKFIYPKKQISMTKGVIHLIKELMYNQKNILLNYVYLKQKKQLDKFESFFVPKTINIFFDTRTIKPNKRFPKLTSTTLKELSKLQSYIIPNKTTLEFIGILKSIKKLLIDSQSYEKPLNQFDYFNPQSEFQLGVSDTSEEEQSNLWHKSFSNSIDLNNFSEIKKIQQIETNKEWLDNSDFHIYSFDIDKLNSKAIEVIMTSFSSYQFTIQLCDVNGKALDDLSFGEQQLLFILNQLYSFKNSQITGIDSIVDNGQQHEIESCKNIDSYIVLLDEIDIGWHPNWQKRMINYICDFLKLIPEKTFHLIFATHSPFILSDIPKENVIFLKDGKQDKTVDIDTFGANIHTLLSHGFFMSDGLMGEFAKEKINKAIEYLNKPKLTQEEIEYCENIISIIGEPIIKNQLQRKLDSKKINYIAKDVKEEIEFLKNRIDILSKRL